MMETFTKNSSNCFLKEALTLFTFMIISVMGFSQSVGISPTGATPAILAAGLDVNFTNKGILIPRVALESTASSAPIESNVAGMIVYNTATAGDVVPGFYYNNGTSWETGFPKSSAAGDIQYWDGTGWAIVPIGQIDDVLQLDGTGNIVWAGNASSATLITNAVSVTGATTATCGGIVLNGGGNTVTAYGVCWSTDPNPTTANSFTNDGSGVGTFASNLTNLISATMYYIRAYAVTSAGESYGNELSFTTE